MKGFSNFETLYISFYFLDKLEDDCDLFIEFFSKLTDDDYLSEQFEEYYYERLKNEKETRSYRLATLFLINVKWIEIANRIKYELHMNGSKMKKKKSKSDI
jgi:hypothetical protein